MSKCNMNQEILNGIGVKRQMELNAMLEGFNMNCSYKEIDEILSKLDNKDLIAIAHNLEHVKNERQNRKIAYYLLSKDDDRINAELVYQDYEDDVCYHMDTLASKAYYQYMEEKYPDKELYLAVKKFESIISNNPHFLEKGVAQDKMYDMLDEALKNASIETREMFGLEFSNPNFYFNWQGFSGGVYAYHIINNLPKEFSKEKGQLISMYKEPMDVINERAYCESVVWDFCTEVYEEVSLAHKIALAYDIAHYEKLSNLFDGRLEEVTTALQRDADPRVRAAIASQGYFDLLQNDPSMKVRSEINNYMVNQFFPT